MPADQFYNNPGEILIAAGTASILICWWLATRGRLRGSFFAHRQVPLTLLGILLCGWFVVQWGGEREASRQRLILIDNANRAAQAINRVHLEHLACAPSDLKDPHYQRLKEQFRTMRGTMPHTRFLYLMKKVHGNIVFQVDSEAPGSPDESPPGQLYQEAPQAMR